MFPFPFPPPPRRTSAFPHHSICPGLLRIVHSKLATTLIGSWKLDVEIPIRTVRKTRLLSFFVRLSYNNPKQVQCLSVELNTEMESRKSGRPPSWQSKDNARSFAALTAVWFRVTPLWQRNPEAWFLQLEAQFALVGITTDATKFNHAFVGQPGRGIRRTRHRRAERRPYAPLRTNSSGMNDLATPKN